MNKKCLAFALASNSSAKVFPFSNHSFNDSMTRIGGREEGRKVGRDEGRKSKNVKVHTKTERDKVKQRDKVRRNE